MLASFHACDSLPFDIDLSIKKHKDSDKTDVHSFRIRGDRPSGPGDLYAFESACL